MGDSWIGSIDLWVDQPSGKGSERGNDCNSSHSSGDSPYGIQEADDSFGLDVNEPRQAISIL
jgi:hypothetical protein